MTRISVTSVVGRTDSTTRPKISVGIAISRSTKRDISMSNQPPTTAAVKPSTEPSVNEIAVATTAMKIVVRAPKIMRDSRSRPRLSVPSQCAADIGSQTSPTISPSW